MWREATHDETEAWLSGWATFNAQETEHGLLIYTEA